MPSLRQAASMYVGSRTGTRTGQKSLSVLLSGPSWTTHPVKPVNTPIQAAIPETHRRTTHLDCLPVCLVASNGGLADEAGRIMTSSRTPDLRSQLPTSPMRGVRRLGWYFDHLSRAIRGPTPSCVIYIVISLLCGHPDKDAGENSSLAIYPDRDQIQESASLTPQSHHASCT